MDDELLKKIESIGDDLPDEASDFIFGGPLDKVSTEISDLIVDENEKKLIVNDITFFLFGVTSLDELVLHIDTLTTTEDNKAKIKQLLQEKIIEELSLILEVHDEMESSFENKEGESSISISPKQALTSIQERLSQASTITPVKRDYSAEKPSEASTGTVTAPKPLVSDPYREMPEE